MGKSEMNLKFTEDMCFTVGPPENHSHCAECEDGMWYCKSCDDDRMACLIGQDFLNWCEYHLTFIPLSTQCIGEKLAEERRKDNETT